MTSVIDISRASVTIILIGGCAGNAAENAIRPFVIGRKNWLFSVSQKGATASANLCSLIETAKANGLETHAYLKIIFMQLPNAQTLEQVEALLPWNYKGGVG